MSVGDLLKKSLPVLLLAGCHLPRDCAGTLERIQDGELRVGITANEPWTRIEDGAVVQVDGIEVSLLEEFARRHNTRIRWHQDTESNLFDALEKGELDVVVGGLTDDTPFAHRAGLSQPFVTIGRHNHVWAVRPGENALLLQIDRFLQARRSDILRRLVSEAPP